MKLQQLAAKPQLEKVIIDNEDIVARYGEPLEFWVYDRQSMDVYMRLSQVDNTSIDDIANTILPLVLDEKGVRALDPKDQLPLDVTVKVIEAVATRLGNPGGRITPS